MPDLLFEDVRAGRVEALREQAPLGDRAPLHRVTVFLTYACNLRCVYCKTIARTPAERRARPQTALTYTPDTFARLLERLGPRPIQHLHLTGGEAALVPHVVELVRRARAHGIPHLSLTSNGTAPPERYAALAHAGLTELRLSLDTHDPRLGEALTGRRDAWARAVASLDAAVAARDAGADLRVIANVVVGHANRASLVEAVRFLLARGPDDVKLITEVDARETLPDFEERPSVEARLAHLLADAPGDSLPLLRRKVRTVFMPDASGLTAAHGPIRCAIPLGERTVDGVGVYPCSVYLREGGAPLARVDEPASVVEARSRAFAEQHDCAQDPLCRRHCLHCTREFNLAAQRPAPP